MNITSIQQALRDERIDGWLFYDARNRDPIAYRILGLDPAHPATRYWYYYIPAHGQPIKLTHKVEPGILADLPGLHDLHTGGTDLGDKLTRYFSKKGRIAMQYSPMCKIPRISTADAGTVELIRSLGNEIVSAADLIQLFEAVLDSDGLTSHYKAADIVYQVKDEAFELMSQRISSNQPITEYDVAQFILTRFDELGLTADGDTPIVGFNDHPANPHYQPQSDNTYTLKRGDTVLIDLWGRLDHQDSVYCDITWCGFVGDRAPEAYASAFEIVIKARDAAVNLVRSRIESRQTCRGYEVDQAARRVISDANYGSAFWHRTGHNIGRENHGPGANIDSFETFDDRRLIPATLFSIEPGIYLPGRFGVRSEIDVLITPDEQVVVTGPCQDELSQVG